MSKATPKRNRPSKKTPGRGAGEAPRHTSKSRELVYAQAPLPEEPDDRSTAFEPTFDDFTVPVGVETAFAAFVRNAADNADGAGGADVLGAIDGMGESGVEETALHAADPTSRFALGRVIRLDRGYPLVATRDGSMRAEHAIALVKGADVRSAVGDWVAVRLPEGHDKALVEAVLPRTGALSRWDGSNRGERQVLAANVDAILIAQPLSKRAVPLDRIVRSVVFAREAGARPYVVLTKADRSPDEERLACDIASVRAAVGPDVGVVAVSSARGIGVEEVRALIEPGRCTLLLGESGVGKSTLVNALLGEEVLGVGEVRGRDDQGRHTTVARRMLKVPGAGVLVDAPGLRSLPLLDEERGMDLAFPEIAARRVSCRFRDCTHGNEPGCAVRAGLDEGAVDAWRLEEYRQLAAEMLANRRSLDPSAKASLTQ